ncbi:type IV pilus modification protein PilV [Luteimonas aestuarii]|nr:type IV pilus modification protein PilV [Luteimonas aestuarii]
MSVMRHSLGRGARRQPGMASRAARMRGVSLIEVLVSVVIIAIGLLGIAAMQSMALRGSQSSLESSQAVMQTNAILEAMRANRVNAAQYNGDWAAPPAGATTAQRDLNEWIAGMQGAANWSGVTLTPAIIGAGANATIAGCPDDCIITLRWDDTRAGGNAARSTFVTRTRI